MSSPETPTKVREPAMLSWIGKNAPALTVVGGAFAAIVGVVWYLSALVGALAPRTAVEDLSQNLSEVTVQAATLATRDDIAMLDEKLRTMDANIAAVGADVNDVRVLFTIMMTCISDQNRQALAALSRSETLPDEPESCRVARAASQEAALRRFAPPIR